jgi:peptide/nickel transport system permease protein
VIIPDRLNERVWRQINGQEQAVITKAVWPIGFFLWLFDPGDTTTINSDFDVVPKGIDWTLGDWHIKGSGALTGDFGDALTIGQGLPVTQAIGSRIGNTALLVLFALVPTILIALPFGVFSAARANSRVDNALTLGTFTGLSLPPYWLGLMLILFLAVIAKNLHDHGWSWLPYLPPGSATAAGEEGDMPDRLYHVLLPAATLAIGQIAVLSRHVRFAMLEVLKKDYVRTAWAKGLPLRRVLFRHAFRNALIPAVTSIVITLPALVSGTVVVETVFGYSGIGQLFFKAMGGELGGKIQIPTFTDYNIVMVLMLLMVVIVVFANFIADVLYVLLNPRMSAVR